MTDPTGAGSRRSDRPILVTGATGYIGGRLVPRLLEAGSRVRCLVRSAAKLRARPWSADPRVEVVEGDAGNPAALERSLASCHAAYYLVHSMIVAGETYPLSVWIMRMTTSGTSGFSAGCGTG